MRAFLNEIVNNAKGCKGNCKECPAQSVHQGEYVNPGLGNYDADIVFVTEEPRHIMDWSKYDTWNDYNDVWWPKIKRADAGSFIARLLELVPIQLDDIWLADSIKCPTKEWKAQNLQPADTKNAENHCNNYLRAEINQVDPNGIVTLGKGATIRTLKAIGVDEDELSGFSVENSFGLCEFDTEIPIVISLHWAQRRVARNQWVPTVKRSISNMMG